jgi:hypothetical protein
MLLAVPASAADLDLSGYSIEDLLALRDRIAVELTERGYAEKGVLQNGVYETGKDIKPGTYIVSFEGTSDVYQFSSVTVYENREKMDKLDSIDIFFVTSDGARITLEDGYILDASAYGGTL